MEDIKEVALKVAREMDREYTLGNSCGVRRTYHEEFASRLVAELQKDAAPVAWMLREKSPLIGEPGSVLLRSCKPKEENIDSSVWDVSPLYTHPQPKATTSEAKSLLEKIDTLIAHVNEGYTAKSKEWAEANFKAADVALEKITEMVGALAPLTDTQPKAATVPEEFQDSVVEMAYQVFNNKLHPIAMAERIQQMLSAAPSLPAAQSSLVVKLGEMRESNGRVTWCVFLAKTEDSPLWDCHQIYSDSIKGRAEYEADSLKHFLGLGPAPDILAYDTDAPAAQSEGEQK